MGRVNPGCYIEVEGPGLDQYMSTHSLAQYTSTHPLAQYSAGAR